MPICKFQTLDLFDDSFIINLQTDHDIINFTHDLSPPFGDYKGVELMKVSAQLCSIAYEVIEMLEDVRCINNVSAVFSDCRYLFL